MFKTLNTEYSAGHPMEVDKPDECALMLLKYVGQSVCFLFEH